MKKFYIALLFAVSCLSMQTASAATLTLTNDAFGTASPSSGSSVTGHSADLFKPNSSIWTLEVSGLGASGLAELTMSFISSASGYTFFSDIPSLTSVSAGIYHLAFFLKPAALTHYDFTINATDVPVSGNVPVPAAVWLFGSALLGLIGMGRRKSQPGFAA
jgi:hypothetical protein